MGFFNLKPCKVELTYNAETGMFEIDGIRACRGVDKLSMIRLLRVLTGISLQQAKEAVDSVIADSGSFCPGGSHASYQARRMEGEVSGGCARAMGGRWRAA